MAQRVQILKVCDVHGDETPGTETISFAVEGARYEIDLCDQHAAQLRDAFAPYVGVASKSGRSSGGASGSGRRRRGSRSGSGPDPAAVRAWARSKGIKVSQRGRIGADVLEKYAARK